MIIASIVVVALADGSSASRSAFIYSVWRASLKHLFYQTYTSPYLVFNEDSGNTDDGGGGGGGGGGDGDGDGNSNSEALGQVASLAYLFLWSWLTDDACFCVDIIISVLFSRPWWTLWSLLHFLRSWLSSSCCYTRSLFLLTVCHTKLTTLYQIDSMAVWKFWWDICFSRPPCCLASLEGNHHHWHAPYSHSFSSKISLYILLCLD